MSAPTSLLARARWTPCKFWPTDHWSPRLPEAAGRAPGTAQAAGVEPAHVVQGPGIADRTLSTDGITVAVLIGCPLRPCCRPPWPGCWPRRFARLRAQRGPRGALAGDGGTLPARGPGPSAYAGPRGPASRPAAASAPREAPSPPAGPGSPPGGSPGTGPPRTPGLMAACLLCGRAAPRPPCSGTAALAARRYWPTYLLRARLIRASSSMAASSSSAASPARSVSVTSSRSASLRTASRDAFICLPRFHRKVPT
jgi:hypothetical protein